MNTRITPNHITELKPNEIFVFGSNLQGYHGGGAARLAMNQWGAVWGQGTGTDVCHPYHARWHRNDSPLHRPIHKICSKRSGKNIPRH